MEKFFDIKCLDEAERDRILEAVRKRIQERMDRGILTEREIREIEEMRLHPVPDLQDVQSVYEVLKFGED